MTMSFITHPVLNRPIGHPTLNEVEALPRPRYKGHWAVGTRHLEEANRFYEVLTGTDVICRPAPFSTAVSWDNEHHRFFIMDVYGMKKDPSTGEDLHPAEGTPQDRTGVGLASIRYASPQALTRVYAQMEANGWRPERIIDRGALISLVYHDPDDLLVETFALVAGGSPTAAHELDAKTFLKNFG